MVAVPPSERGLPLVMVIPAPGVKVTDELANCALVIPAVALNWAVVMPDKRASGTVPLERFVAVKFDSAEPSPVNAVAATVPVTVCPTEKKLLMFFRATLGECA